MTTTPTQALQRYWRERHREGQGTPTSIPAASIALMREAGAPGTQIAREVGTRLGWQVYDRELLERIANELGLRTSLLESVDERHKAWLTESLEAFGSGPSVNESTYVRHLVQTLLSLGALGHCVIVGRGAAFILPADRTLRVRLVGDLKDRVEGTMRRRGLSHDEAARWVEQTERERNLFIRDHFNRDLSDVHEYDLVLNTSHWSVAECADLIADAARRLEARLTGK
jgi:cytidylate kinase